MKTVSIKRLVLAFIIGMGSVMTLPAYAWPDTDEMNMCGTAVKKVRAYGNNFTGWAEHDNFLAKRGKDFYYRNNCPQSTATKNYKGKNWTPKAKMRAKSFAKPIYKHHKKFHNKHHKNHADCIRVDRMNTTGAVVSKPKQKVYQTDRDFYRQAQAVLNMSKVKRVMKVHNPNHKNHADCVRTDGLNKSGAIVQVVRRK